MRFVKQRRDFLAFVCSPLFYANVVKTSDFDFKLPEELIAQEPLPERTASRMMVLRRSGTGVEHATVAELPRFLARGDLLMLNNTRVIPARLFGERVGTGGRVEILLVEETAPNEWECMVRASRPARAGSEFTLAHGRVRAHVLRQGRNDRPILRLASDEPLAAVLAEEGVPPVPPYIRRDYADAPDGASVRMDRERYQTVYADRPGAVAAPTAGLHFSEDLFRALAAAGILRTELTLHVGPGTFRPVKAERVEDHVMEEERYEIPAAAAGAVAAARRRGNRVVAVGSTTVRTLETAAQAHGEVVPCSGRTDLFIRPPYAFRAVDAMLTNFHLPRSTLLMMVSALAGRERVLQAYREAVRARYRFYSYGDCMLIL